MTRKKHGTGGKRELLGKLSLCVVTIHDEANIEFQVNIVQKTSLAQARRFWELHTEPAEPRHRQQGMFAAENTNSSFALVANPSQQSPCCWNEQGASPNSRINARLFKYWNFAKIHCSESNESRPMSFLFSLTIHYSHYFCPEPLKPSCLPPESPRCRRVGGALGRPGAVCVAGLLWLSVEGLCW